MHILLQVLRWALEVNFSGLHGVLILGRVTRNPCAQGMRCVRHPVPILRAEARNSAGTWTTSVLNSGQQLFDMRSDSILEIRRHHCLN